jgi:MTH538 TIR-like domain (DUF1863)
VAKHVFLSFVEEDLADVNLFRGQAKKEDSNLEFDDYSVKVPYDSSDADYIRQQITKRIRACSTTICLIGATTRSSRWVGWEIRKSYELGNNVIGVRLDSDVSRNPTPKALTDIGAKICNWNIAQIVRAL